MKYMIAPAFMIIILAGCAEKVTVNDQSEAADTAAVPADDVAMLDDDVDTSESMMPDVVVDDLEIVRTSHANAVLSWGGTTIYSDPVDEVENYASLPGADIVFVTHTHPDHFNAEVLAGIVTEDTTLIMPQAVADELTVELTPNTVILGNGEEAVVGDITVTAVPSYNVRAEAQKNHPQGRDNGYVLERGGKRIYFSGDSGPTPDMQALKDIDIAFVAMNLPYTMSVESAAQAVLAFAPKTVYPYHYRTPDGFSDVAVFKELVNAGNPDIEVIQLDWYPDSN